MSWGILVRYFGEAVDHHTLDFVKEFGLILFVFTIGLQVRPGLIAALRQQGVKLTMLAAAIVIPAQRTYRSPIDGEVTRFPDCTRSEAAEMGRAGHGVADGAGDARHGVVLINERRGLGGAIGC